MRNRLTHFSGLVVVAALLTAIGCDRRAVGQPPPAEQPGPLIRALRQAEEGRKYSAEEIYQKLIPSTVMIVTTIRKEGDTLKTHGTGWVVDREKRLVMTNEHVVLKAHGITCFFPDRNADGDVITATKHYTAEAERLGIRGKLVARSPLMDLAIVELERMPDDAVALTLAPKSASSGQGVYSIGTSGAHLEDTEIGAIWRYTTGLVRLIRRMRAHNESGFRDTTTLETTSPTNSGDSGGPMVNDRMQLVGVVAGNSPDDRLVSLSIDVGEVRKFLQDYRDGKALGAPGADLTDVKPGVDPPPADGDPAKPKPLERKPGYAIGRVYRTDGKPIEGALSQQIAIRSTFNQQYLINVKPDGTYSQKLAAGDYRVEQSIAQIPFDERTFTMLLRPMGGEPGTDQSSEAGIVQDFVMPVGGVREGMIGDETKRNSWYGGLVQLQYKMVRNDVRRAVPPVPAGTKCVITFTPKGKLIDGSEGKVLTRSRSIEPRGWFEKEGWLHDIPIGVYTIKGEEQLPDGKVQALLFVVAFGKYAETMELHFEPYSTGGADVQIVNITRQLE